ncbi:CU044_5270 family protein [Actinomadura sp. 6K520]|jgi:hypothetical protein|uniref:CU044_5270 family protein n=1 Tax=Actinomadura sp. 6K520 TaxID=2530364 RepID=UPI00104E1D42|nr:CU044_5270 family protein [Actinomadura sp. 6K520]TDE33300.1 hypothetical protein E1289_12955 [Actinomadura sp. 6K520]
MNDEDIALISRIRPSAEPHDPHAKARAWARLQAEFGSASDRRPAPRARVDRRAALAVAATTVGAMTLVAAQLGGVFSGGTPERGPDTNLRTLELAASTVEHQRTPPRPTPGQWVYTRQTSRFEIKPGNAAGRDAELHDKVKVEEWWKFDGRQMAKSVEGGQVRVTRILRPGERPAPGRADPRFNGGIIGGPGVVSRTPNRLYDYVAGLPTDPDALLERIRRDHGDDGGDVTTFGVIARLLRDDQLIPPRTNAALYRALAKIPGVRVTRDATDYAGRHGIGVIAARGRGRDGRLIVLNPETYRYMGDRDHAILDTAVVNEPGERP